jgi:hypothetical protein
LLLLRDVLLAEKHQKRTNKQNANGEKKGNFRVKSLGK